MTYSEKLLDPRWQKKRLEILDRDDFSCQWCGDKETTLHVHHEDYEGENPWDTPNYLLITLCKDCHDLNHLGLNNLEKLLLETIRESNIGNIKYIKSLHRVAAQYKTGIYV